MNKKILFNRISLPKKIAILVFAIFSISVVLYASSNGKSGKTSSSSQGCNCHGSSNNASSLSISSSSGSFTVDPNSNNNFTVSIANANMQKAGIGIAVKTSATGSTNAGSLSPVSGSGLKTEQNELVHSSPKNLSSGSASFEFTWTAPSAPGTYYVQAVGNAVNDNGGTSGDQWNWMQAQVITVRGIILAGPTGGQSWCAGSSQDITWTHTGVDNVKIELSSDGGQSFTETLAASVSADLGAWTWNIPAAFQEGDSYRIKVSDASNSELKDESTSNFTIGGAPMITLNPENQNLCSGETLSLSVAASGAGISYQWQKDNQDINGATSKDLVISNITLSDAGEYKCVVSGNCGDDITSTIATVTITESASITTHPSGQSVCPGEDLTLNVIASGNDLTYQWMKDGSNINNATSASYTIENISENDEGNYSVKVTGACDMSVTSQNAQVKVINNPSIIAQSADTVVCVNSKTNLFVFAGLSTMTYQWSHNGNEIAGATEKVLTIDETSLDDAGDYTCAVTNTCDNSTVSEIVILTVTPEPIFVTHPESLTANMDETVTLTVSAENADSYQWYKDDEILSAENSSTLELTINSEAMYGNYYCKISNSCFEVQSETASITKPIAGPALTLTQTIVNFEAVLVNTSKELNLMGLLRNSGGEELTISEIIISGANKDDYTIISPSLPVAIPSGQSLDMIIEFMPTGTGLRVAEISFNSNAEENPTLALSGTGGFIEYSIIGSVDFGTVPIDSSKNMDITLENTGNMPIEFDQIQITGAKADHFTVISPSSSFIVDAQTIQNIDVMFTAKTSDDINATLELTESLTGEKKTVELLGIGLTSSVDDIQLSSISVSPNPATDKIIIKLDVNSINYNAQIFDIYGNEIISLYPESSELVWNTKDKYENLVPQGIYYLIISDGKQRFSKKIIINR